jgi:hypothetical protein
VKGRNLAIAEWPTGSGNLPSNLSSGWGGSVRRIVEMTARSDHFHSIRF